MTPLSAIDKGNTQSKPEVLAPLRVYSQNDASIYGKEALIEILKKKEVGGRVFSKDAADARLIIDEVDIQQVISPKEVMVILSCQTTKARLVLKMMEISIARET